MAIQKYVHGEYFKKLIDDKLVNTNSVKHILKQKGIVPICNSIDSLSELVYRILFGSGTMTQIHNVMNFEQNNLKSTMVVINPKHIDCENDFLTNVADEFINRQRIPNTKYKLENIRKDNSGVTLQYSFEKPQKGRVSLAESRVVTLDVSITPIDSVQYKVSIRHEGMSESKQFISLLDDMTKVEPSEQVFSIKRVTLSSLLKDNKVDFFDQFGTYQHTLWTVINITNVTVNKNESTIDEDSDDSNAQEINDNEPMGKLTGISTAILTGDGLRNNDFVKECMAQNFIFSSMRYKLSHNALPIVIEIDVNFKQTDLKINIIKTYRIEDDGKESIAPLPPDEQSEIINYFQNVAYEIYLKLLERQREDAKAKPNFLHLDETLS